MAIHHLSITLPGCVRATGECSSRRFRSSRPRSGCLAHLSGMNTRQLGWEPLMGIEELAGYFGVPVQTVYDWRVVGMAPRAFKFGKRLKFAVSDVQSWLAAHQEVGPKDVHSA